MFRRLAVLLMIVTLALVGCVAPVAPDAAAEEAAAEAPVEGEAAFPVTLEHKFGSTTIEAAPQRVVALGFTDQDAVLAAGVTPIAVRYFFGPEDDQVWPWADAAVTGEQPIVLNQPFGTLNFEAIAELNPDLITAVSAGLSEEEYNTLSQIAPTLAQSNTYVDFGVPWQEQTIVIGQALGREAQAREQVAAMEDLFAEVRAAHPEFEGATAAIASPAGEGQFFFSGPQHERQRFLTSLGFVLPAELAELAGDAFYGTISGERMDLLDTDVLLWTTSAEQKAALEVDPVYQTLAVAQEGRDLYLDTTGADGLAGPAIVFGSVLSFPAAFEELVPQLAERLAAQ